MRVGGRVGAGGSEWGVGDEGACEGGRLVWCERHEWGLGGGGANGGFKKRREDDGCRGAM